MAIPMRPRPMKLTLMNSSPPDELDQVIPATQNTSQRGRPHEIRRSKGTSVIISRPSFVMTTSSSMPLSARNAAIALFRKLGALSIQYSTTGGQKTCRESKRSDRLVSERRYRMNGIRRDVDHVARLDLAFFSLDLHRRMT